MCRLILLILVSLVSGSMASDALASDLRSFDDIERALAAPEAPRTVEDFLKLARERNPELFAGFTLMRESKSLQGASPAAPRAIVFGRDARLVLTFNGKPDQAGFNHVEMMQFVPTAENTGYFQLREIRFAQDGATSASLSEINPPTCARCHGTHPKPIWEEYDHWPGAYGEDDDALIDFDDGRDFPPSGYLDSEIVNRHRQHLAEFRAFKKQQPTDPRYRFLRFPEGTESPVAPYIPRGRSGQDPLRPNLRLTGLFADLNAKKIAQEFVRRGDQCFKQGAPLIMALVLDCDNFTDSKEKLARASSLLNDDLKASAWPPALEPAVFSRRNPSLYKNGIVHLLQLSGFSDFEWSPARATRQWQYFKGFTDASDSVASEVWPELQRLGFKLPPYNAIRSQRYPDYYRNNYSDSSTADPIDRSTESDSSGYINHWDLACQGLLQNSDEFSVANVAASCQDQKIEPSVPAVIKMCMSCHDGSGQAPNLPLDNASKVLESAGLRDLIMNRINHRDRSMKMPPDRPLTVDEYRSILSFYQRH
jgi:hypothetical protein